MVATVDWYWYNQARQSNILDITQKQKLCFPIARIDVSKIVTAFFVYIKWSIKVTRILHGKFRSSCPECSVKKLFLEISQSSQETPVPESILIKLRGSGLNFIKKSLWHRCFSVNFAKFLRYFIKKSLWHRCFSVSFAKFLKTTFFYRTPLVAASKSSFQTIF